MSLDTFKACGEYCVANDDHIFLGGGEPTLHPQFWEIVGLTMDYNADWAADNGCAPIQLVTNGSQTKTVLKLAKLALEGQVYVRLSRDQFHQIYELDPKVLEAFKDAGTRHGHPDNPRTDGRDKGGYILKIVNRGRAKRRGIADPSDKGCDACGPMVTPDGRIWRCTCRTEELGTVFAPKDVDLSMLQYDAGCSIKDGTLIPDPSRDGQLRKREDMEAEGWLFNPQLGKGQLEFDLNPPPWFKKMEQEKEHGTINSNGIEGLSAIGGSIANSSDQQSLPSSTG